MVFMDTVNEAATHQLPLDQMEEQLLRVGLFDDDDYCAPIFFLLHFFCNAIFVPYGSTSDGGGGSSMKSIPIPHNFNNFSP